MQVVHTKTRAEYDELISILDKKGGSWCSRTSMKGCDAWKIYEHNTCIDINDINLISYFELEYFTIRWYTILSLNEYKAMNDITEECEFKRGERIMVRDYTEDEYDEVTFLAYIEWAENPYICVESCSHNAYNNWKLFAVSTWKYTKKKPTHLPEEIEKAKRLLIETGEKWATF